MLRRLHREHYLVAGMIPPRRGGSGGRPKAMPEAANVSPKSRHKAVAIPRGMGHRSGPFGAPAGRLGSPQERCGCSSGVEHNLAKVGVVGSNPIARSSHPTGKKPRESAAFVVSGAGESLSREQPEAGAVAARL